MAAPNSDLITPMVITYNEAPNILRCLDKLTWAKRVIVIDSYSTDGTQDLVKKFKNVELVEHSFESFASQWNYGMQKLESPWALCLDADYVLTDELEQELQTMDLAAEVEAYQARFRYCIAGKALRTSLLPARKVLLRKHINFGQDGHAQQELVTDSIGALNSYILHDDRKSLGRWFKNQTIYAKQEAEKLLSTGFAKLSIQDKLRLMLVPAPLAVFVYLVFFKLILLDGWRGLVYLLQRVYAEIVLSLLLVKNFFAQAHQS